jgi:gas vesicle protein
MGDEPAELRRDIERRREDLGETIDAIGDRVSPGRMIERRRNRMASGMRSFKERVMGSVSSGTEMMGDAAGSVREHVGPDAVRQQTAGSPLGAGLVAFGIGFIAAAALPPTPRETEAARKAQDALEPAKDAIAQSAQAIAGDLKEGASTAAADVKDAATEAAGTVAESAKQEATAAKEDVRGITSS